jgi:hypothetical protein
MRTSDPFRQPEHCGRFVTRSELWWMVDGWNAFGRVMHSHHRPSGALPSAEECIPREVNGI